MTKPAFLLDLLVVLVFAAAGRASHDLGGGVLGVLSTAWPFLVGMVAGWAAVLRQPGRRPTAAGRPSSPPAAPARRPARSHLWWLDGLVVAVSTLVIGMLLRSLSGGGTALPFVLVATGMVIGGLVGWRAVAALVDRRRGAATGAAA